MRKLLLTLLLLPIISNAATVLQSADAYKINRASKLNSDLRLGTRILDASQQGVRGKWVYSDAASGAIGAHNLVDHEGQIIKLPASAVITDCVMDVVTQPLPTTTTAVASINTQGDNANVKGYQHYSLLTTGLKDCTPTGTAASAIKIASEKALQITFSSEAVTAGKILVWVEYVLSE